MTLARRSHRSHRVAPWRPLLSAAVCGAVCGAVGTNSMNELEAYLLDDGRWVAPPDGSEKVKRLAARCGRTLDKPKHKEEIAKLSAHMATLGTGELRYWAKVVMISHLWNGATGEGGYWAVASRVVNEVAARLLGARRGPAPFWITEGM